MYTCRAIIRCSAEARRRRRRRARPRRTRRSRSGRSATAPGVTSVDVLVLGLERGHRLPPASGSPAISRMRGSPLTIVFESPRLFCANVSCSASTHGAERVEAGLRGARREARRGSCRASRLTVWTPICVPSPNRRTVAGWRDGRRDRHLDLDVLADARGGGRVDALDDDLIGGAEADDVRLDLDTARGGQRGLRLAAAGGVVAVGDEHDALLRLVGEERRGEAQRATDVRRGCRRARTRSGRGRSARRAAAPPAPRRRTRRWPPGRRPRPLLQRVADEGEGRFAAGAGRRVGEVDHEDRGQPIDRPHDREAGEGQDQAREDDARGSAETRGAGPCARWWRAAMAEPRVIANSSEPSEEQLGPADGERQAHAALSRRAAPAAGQRI